MSSMLLLALGLYMYSKGAFGSLMPSSNPLTAPAKWVKVKKGQTSIFIAPKGTREDNFFATLAKYGHKVSAPVPEQAAGMYRVTVTYAHDDSFQVLTGIILAQTK